MPNGEEGRKFQTLEELRTYLQGLVDAGRVTPEWANAELERVAPTFAKSPAKERPEQVPYWGLTIPEFNSLLKETENESALDTQLRNFITQGFIEYDDVVNIKKYILQQWDMQEAMEMERQQARELARVRTLAKEEQETRPAEPKPIEVPPAYTGERWTPAAQSYEQKRAEAWYARYKQKQAAEQRAVEIEAGVPSEQAVRFAEEVQIPAEGAARLGYGFYTGGGGALREGELEQLQGKSPEERRALYDIGREMFERSVMESEKAQAERVGRPYVPPLYEELEVRGTPTWKQWFESKYGSIARQFVAKAPEGRGQESWAEFLKGQEAAKYEEWWQRGAYARGERPSAFAPGIRTVRW